MILYVVTIHIINSSTLVRISSEMGNVALIPNLPLKKWKYRVFEQLFYREEQWN